MIVSLIAGSLSAVTIGHAQTTKKVVKPDQAEIIINIKGIPDTVINMYHGADNAIKHVLHVKDGKFIWRGAVPEPEMGIFAYSGGIFNVFMENSRILVQDLTGTGKNISVTGSAVQDEWAAYNASLKDLDDSLNSEYMKYGKVNEEEQLALEKKIRSLNDQKNKRDMQYVAQHPNSPVSVSLVTRVSDYQNVDAAYSKLGAKALESKAAKRIPAQLEMMKRSAIGAQIIDFAQADTSGKVLHYSDMKGKYILIDFWASWCGPCRAENPNVLKAYNNFKDKNFTVLGVSLDNNATKWKEAIIKDAMPWTHVSDLKGWKNELSTYYGVRGIPYNLLIDPEGRIVEKNLRGASLHKRLEEILNKI